MSEEPIRLIERCYLSSVFKDEGCLNHYLRSGIGPEAFSEPFHQLIVGKMSELAEKAVSVDIATLARHLASCGEMNRFDLLVEIEEAVETAMNSKSHWLEIVDAWRMRNFKAQTMKLELLAKQEKWSDVEAEVAGIAATLSDDRLEDDRRTQVEVAQSAIDERKRVMEGKPVLNSNPIYTGIECVDRFCRPLDTATGDFNNILFAATSIGKSSLMAGIVRHNAFRKMRIAAFLGETNHEGLLYQMAGQQVRAAIDSYEFCQEPMDRQVAFLECLEDIRDLHGKTLFVYDDDFYMEDILGRCRKIEREFGKIDLIVIDHLHCLKTRKAFKDERLRFNYMSGEIKPLGKRHNCPVLALAQPNRMFKTENRVPQLSDLKETGNLEDDADRIWALHLPLEDSEGMSQDRYSDNPQIQLHQLKFRRGRPCSVNLRMEKRYTRFYDEKQERR